MKKILIVYEDSDDAILKRSEIGDKLESLGAEVRGVDFNQFVNTGLHNISTVILCQRQNSFNLSYGHPEIVNKFKAVQEKCIPILLHFISQSYRNSDKNEFPLYDTLCNTAEYVSIKGVSGSRDKVNNYIVNTIVDNLTAQNNSAKLEEDFINSSLEVFSCIDFDDTVKYKYEFDRRVLL